MDTPKLDASSETEAVLTCLVCGHKEREVMPTNACQYFYDCKGCGAVIKPLPGDCCVFCSYSDSKCPPMQQGQSDCS